ncbi:MAG TPA: hypothetical protein VHW47_09435 [Acidimicrobiales bacterium]|jgi:hypothetical protein|nr:hypothetical protein [Acidimicrobiales bacterium]
MARFRPKVLAIAGVVAVVLGAVCCMVFAVAQTSCQNGPNGLTLDPQLANLCAPQAWGARIGFIVLAVGGVLVLLAGLAATPRYREVREARAGRGTVHG